MKIFRKIAKVLVVAAFFCTFTMFANKAFAICPPGSVLEGDQCCVYTPIPGGGSSGRKTCTPLSATCPIGTTTCKSLSGAVSCCSMNQTCNTLLGQCEAKKNEQKSQAGGGCATFADCASGLSCISGKCVANSGENGECGTAKNCQSGYHCDMNKFKCVKDEVSTPTVVGTTNTPQKAGSADGKGCSASGIFSGLVCKGAEIFKGLRDLIYVVAGFGIIGVAVGGFFGNLNWKWLGAIIIGLVVIATTGEIINAIAGQNITSGMITDTLK